MTSLAVQPRDLSCPGLDPALVQEGPDGTVYLIHLITPLWSLGRTYSWSHYIGWASNGRLVTRLRQHERGQGSRFLSIARDRGCDWILARTWQGSPLTERRIKNQGGASRFCPACGIVPLADRQLLRDPQGRYITPPEARRP